MKSVTVKCGVSATDAEKLQQLADADPDARGSVRFYTGRILSEHARSAPTPAAKPQQPSRSHVAAGKH